MVSEKTRSLSKVWTRFSKAMKNGTMLPFRWEKLPKHRFEEFIDFKINYFVKHESVHVATVLYKNMEAIKEYRRHALIQCKDSEYHHAICCVDDDSSRMVAIDSVKLFKKDEIYSGMPPPQTTEMKKLYEIFQKWDNMYSIPEVLVKYGVEKLFDDAGLAVHPDFRSCNFTIEVGLLRRTVCKAFGVPLAGAWMTSTAVQKASEHDNWEIVYEVSPATLEILIGVKFPNAAPMFQYKVKRME